jgi:hypothetical protein
LYPAAPPLPTTVPLLLIVIIDLANKLVKRIAEEVLVPVPDTVTPELIVKDKFKGLVPVQPAAIAAEYTL